MFMTGVTMMKVVVDVQYVLTTAWNAHGTNFSYIPHVNIACRADEGVCDLHAQNPLIWMLSMAVYGMLGTVRSRSPTISHVRSHSYKDKFILVRLNYSTDMFTKIIYTTCNAVES